jgi:phosphatidate cytidylyltransferase
MIARRVATAAVGIPLLLAALWLGGPVWDAFVTALALVGVWEMVALLAAAGSGARPLEAAAAALLTCAGAAAAAQDPHLWPLWLAGPAAAVALAFALFLLADARRPLSDFQAVWATALYPALLMTFLMAIRDGPHGFWRAVAAFALVWIGDAAAFAVGSVLGGPRPFPGVSPRKTVSGGIAGLLGATVTAFLAHGWLGLAPAPAALVGLSGGLLAQFGDLAESLLKRRAGLKDSGALLPGHGGILDRFDGVLVALPWVWLVLFFAR